MKTRKGLLFLSLSFFGFSSLASIEERLDQEWKEMLVNLRSPSQSTPNDYDNVNDIEDLEAVFEAKKRRALSRQKKRSPVSSSKTIEILDLDSFEKEISKKQASK